jgi:phosphatidylserine/phosphatidylglycerophosphate/cardiolipin synthase-like enzyme
VATDEVLEPRPSGRDLWPDGLQPQFRSERLAIARTMPPWRGEHGVREAAALTRDALLSAERHVYIEAQYLTARYVRDVLLDLLEQPNGPEILIVLTRGSDALAERLIMGNNGNRNIRRLKKADKYDRLRVYYPVSPGKADDGKDCTILVHSKLVIVDDLFLRIGSSNMNNRSVGLDTECDVAIEADRAESRRAIVALRDKLIGEHVGLSGEEMAEAIAAAGGSILRAVEASNCNGRCLKPFSAMKEKGPDRNFFGTWLLDPARPFEPFWFLRLRPRRPTLPHRRRTHGVTT